jgi:hypothetical protein
VWRGEVEDIEVTWAVSRHRRYLMGPTYFGPKIPVRAGRDLAVEPENGPRDGSNGGSAERRSQFATRI